MTTGKLSHAFFRFFLLLSIISYVRPFFGGAVVASFHHASRYPSTTRLGGVLDSDDGSSGTKDNWINPFEQNSSTLKRSGRSAVNVSNVSLRKMRMNDLVSSLLRCIGDDESMQTVMLEEEALLMEPFGSEYDPRLDPDSIYDVNMDREQKLRLYSQVMEERIQSAKSGNARIILNAMKKFVETRSSEASNK